VYKLYDPLDFKKHKPARKWQSFFALKNNGIAAMYMGKPMVCFKVHNHTPCIQDWGVSRMIKD